MIMPASAGDWIQASVVALALAGTGLLLVGALRGEDRDAGSELSDLEEWFEPEPESSLPTPPETVVEVPDLVSTGSPARVPALPRSHVSSSLEPSDEMAEGSER